MSDEDALAAVPVELRSRLTKDLRDSAKLMDRDTARFLVDIYYTVQNYRIRSSNQKRASAVDDEPHALVAWTFEVFHGTEADIARALKVYAANSPLGEWALSIHGIGPVITAGLLSHINIERAPTAGAIWRFAGLDPTNEWRGASAAKELVSELAPKGAKVTEEVVREAARRWKRKPEMLLRFATTTPSGESRKLTRDTLASALAKRPWNAKLKRLCFLIGSSFVRQRASKNDDYGYLYDERKAMITEANEAGQYAETARRTLEQKKFSDNDTRAAYEAGMLPLGRVDLMARRWVVKLFLSHYHHVGHWTLLKRPPPKPFSHAHLGHQDLIPIPKWTEPPAPSVG